jgi:hypothetical protein
VRVGCAVGSKAGLASGGGTAFPTVSGRQF